VRRKNKEAILKRSYCIPSYRSCVKSSEGIDEPSMLIQGRIQPVRLGDNF